MNKKRREKIIESIKILEEAKIGLQGILDDEQFSFDNIPENLQSSLRADESETAIDSMEGAIEMIESAVDELKSIN